MNRLDRRNALLAGFVAGVLLLAGCEPGSEHTSQTPGVLAAEHSGGYTEFQFRKDPFRYLEDLAHSDTERFLAAKHAEIEMYAAPLESQRRQLQAEINRHLVSSRQSAPVYVNGVTIIEVIEKGKQYPVYYRQASDLTRHQLLDLNEFVTDSGYLRPGGLTISEDRTHLALSLDRRGSEAFELLFVPLDTGRVRYPLQNDADLTAIGPSLQFSQDGKFLYVTDAQTTAVYRIKLQDMSRTLVFQETDPAFSVALVREASGGVQIISESLSTTEIHLVRETGELVTVATRQPDHRYRVQPVEIAVDAEGSLLALSNFKGFDFQVARAKPGQSPADWEYLDINVPGDILDFQNSDRYLFLRTRYHFADRLYAFNLEDASLTLVRENTGGDLRLLSAKEESGEVYFIIRESSLIKPTNTLECRLSDKTCLSIHEQKIPGYEKADFIQKQVAITATDGAEIPVSLMHRKDLAPGDNPVFVRAYGAYGLSLPRRMDATLLPLLNRGFVIAFVHVRGFGESGNPWHREGSHKSVLLSAVDLLDAVSGLSEQGFGDKDKMFFKGSSAGGTLGAVALNVAPNYFRGVVLRAPYVDVLTDLVYGEMSETQFLEWGDPNDHEVYLDILEYSPYDQVSARAYPPILVTTSLNDPRVPYHHGLKWIAKITRDATTEGPFLIDIVEDSGHLGPSDQYQRRRRDSLEYAFILSLLEGD